MSLPHNIHDHHSQCHRARLPLKAQTWKTPYYTDTKQYLHRTSNCSKPLTHIIKLQQPNKVGQYCYAHIAGAGGGEEVEAEREACLGQLLAEVIVNQRLPSSLGPEP